MLMLLTKEFGNLKGRGGRAAGVERDGRGEVFRGEKGSLTHDEPPLFSSMALDMRNAGSQLPQWTAAFIPPKGIVLEAIDPARICEGTGLEKCSIPEKERPSIDRRAGARVVKKQWRGHCH